MKIGILGAGSVAQTIAAKLSEINQMPPSVLAQSHRSA